MKTLIVYDNTGNITFTQTNCNSVYNCFVADVDETKEISKIDITNKTVIYKENIIQDTSKEDETKKKIEALSKQLLAIQEELNNLLSN